MGMTGFCGYLQKHRRRSVLPSLVQGIGPRLGPAMLVLLCPPCSLLREQPELSSDAECFPGILRVVSTMVFDYFPSCNFVPVEMAWKASF